jgi:hypothetical protein
MSLLYRNMFIAVNKVRAKKNDWPDYIFVPMSKLPEICRYMEDDGIKKLMIVRGAFSSIASAGMTFSTWRMTQGIYRFDETLYSELIRTRNSGAIPTDILIRLPEWCVYLETPGLPMFGVWARIDLDHDDNLWLILTQDTDSDDYSTPLTQYMAINSGTIEQNIAKAMTDWIARCRRFDLDKDVIIATTLEWVHPVINLLLYLCAGADYAGATVPNNPLPTKTKRGPRLFPPQKETTWNVGTRMGAALRTAYTAQARSEGGATGEHVRPHIRRAHWHGFRSGPMLDAQGEPIPKENRPFDLRWLPPIPVNIGENEALPSVIRPVKDEPVVVIKTPSK